MTAEERRFVALGGEALHTWLKRYGEWETVQIRPWKPWYAKWLDDRMQLTEPSLADTLSDLSDDALEAIWDYALRRDAIRLQRRADITVRKLFAASGLD